MMDVKRTQTMMSISYALLLQLSGCITILSIPFGFRSALEKFAGMMFCTDILRVEDRGFRSSLSQARVPATQPPHPRCGWGADRPLIAARRPSVSASLPHKMRSRVIRDAKT